MHMVVDVHHIHSDIRKSKKVEPVFPDPSHKDIWRRLQRMQLRVLLIEFDLAKLLALQMGRDEGG